MFPNPFPKNNNKPKVFNNLNIFYTEEISCFLIKCL